MTKLKEPDVTPEEPFESQPVNRFDIGGQRYYSPCVKDDVPWEERQFSPSVTTILNVLNKGPILTKWAINKFPTHEAYKDYLNYLAFLGTITHRFIDEMIQGYTVRLDGLAMDEDGVMVDLSHPKYKRPLQGFLGAFLKFWNDKEITPIASEVQLWTDGFSGTIDLLAEIKYRGKPKYAIFDWKTRAGIPMTGDHPGARGHGLQLTGYKLLCDAYDELPTPDLMYNVYLGEQGGYTLKPREFKPEMFYHALALWKDEFPDPPKKPKELPIEFNLTEEKEDD